MNNSHDENNTNIQNDIYFTPSFIVDDLLDTFIYNHFLTWIDPYYGIGTFEDINQRDDNNANIQSDIIIEISLFNAGKSVNDNCLSDLGVLNTISYCLGKKTLSLFG